MITGELKSKIDRIWDTMWSGGISNPLSVIEQLTYLLFIKRLDELQTLKEAKTTRTGKPHRTADLRRRPRQAPLVALQGGRPRAEGRDSPRRGVPLHQNPWAEGRRRRRRGLHLHTPHEGRPLHDAHGPGAGQRCRPARRPSAWPTATPKATCTSTCSAKSPPPVRTGSSAPRAHIIQADGGHDRARTEGRDLRSGVRHGGLPHRYLQVPCGAPQRHDLQGHRRPSPLQRGHVPRLRLRPTPCCASAA